MTTIGTAVLQIIPSLKGVTDAIEKQIDGKVVEVKIAPKVDATAAKKAGKDTGEAIVKETTAAVSKGEIGKAVADDLKDSVKKAAPGKEIAKIVADDVKKESPGGGIAKVILEGLADGVKQGLPSGGVGGVIVDSISDGVLPGLKGIGSVISGQLREGAKEWSSGIAEALRGGDIQGAATQISDTIKGTTDTISTIGETFGLQLDGVRAFGDGAGPILSGVAGDVGGVLDKALTMKSSFADTADLLGDTLPGRAGSGAKSIINSLGTIIPVATGVFDALNNITQNWHAEQQEKWWADWEADQHARDLGLKPQQPGVGDFGGPPAVGQGNAAQAPPKPRLGDDLRARVAAGLLPGFSIGPNGDIIGLDGKPVQVPGRAIGGLIKGLGTGISDSILARVSNGEFVVNADATRKNMPLLEMINSDKLPGFAGGGLVAGDEQLKKIIGDRFGISNIGGYRPADKYGEHSTGRALDVMVGNDKSKGDAVKDFALANASAIDLKWAIWRQHLYYPGGGGYDMQDRGSPTQNHMDHVHIFSGTGITNGLRGALAGGGAPGGNSAPVAMGGPGAEDLASSDQTAAAPAGASPSGAVSGGPLPTSISGLATAPFDAMTAAGKANSGPGHRDPAAYFPTAASAAIGGQINSALGVFGVNGSPQWLSGLSNALGQVKVGGHDPSGVSDGSLFNGSNLFGGGQSAAPISALSAIGGASLPDAAHGGRAGQQPGPQTVVNYNIRTATVEDAFLQSQRRQDVRTAAKLDRY